MSGITIARKLKTAQPEPLRALEIETLQVNLGYGCNMTCNHCHVKAGPLRSEAMGEEQIEAVLSVIEREAISKLDITGGAPEINPHFRMLVEKARHLDCHVMVRTNLTIFFEPGMEDLPQFYAGNRVEVIASLPHYRAKDVDGVRGVGTFKKSILALRRLNSLGYGFAKSGAQSGDGLLLNLAVNPSGAFPLPPQQTFEEEMRRELTRQFGISFNRLYMLANMPIGRFEDFLVRTGNFTRYMDEIEASFNPETLQGIMCRHLISVGPDGRLYDCDFNQLTGRSLLPKHRQHIREFDRTALARRQIALTDYCFVCMARQGST